MYTFKSIARRGTLLATAAALAVAAVLPSTAVFADALNPLTERSLSLSSGSPGWSYLDASGNGTYAPPNSGANGKNTGNTFSFRVTSTATVKGFSFQYCTTSAGNCMGPGNIPFAGTAGSLTRGPNDATQFAAQKSDLEVVTNTPSEVTTFGTKFNAGTGVPSSAANIPNRNNSEGNFIVLHKATAVAPWVQATGWDMDSSVNQIKDGAPGVLGDGTSTGKDNYMTLTNATGGLSLASGDYVKVIFFGTDDNYMINPGAGAFFAKLNTYSSDSSLVEANILDGGVTVANVMNRSIEIQTKVLETMDFSVGVVDPNTLDSTDTDTGTPGVQSQLKTANDNDKHGTCDPVLPGMTQNTATPNILQMGNADGEFSLETDDTYSTHSYWRLSSNSSAGATVYYSGVTLSNTVGDQIDPIGIEADSPTVGMEQFGLALANGTAGDNYQVSYDQERDTSLLFENGVDNGLEAIHTASLTADNVFANASWHTPRLAPLLPEANYGNGTGNINTEYNAVADDTAFAFDPDSTVIPTPIASENNDVVDCVTGKVRYIANIAATTPAGIYATKVNWIAAPQY